MTQKAQNKAHKDKNNSFRKAQSLSQSTKHSVKAQLRICISRKPKRESTLTKKEQKEGAKHKKHRLANQEGQNESDITKTRAYK